MPAYQTFQQNGILLDQLTDEKTGLRITVSRTGAEMVSLARRDASGNWRGFLYRDGETEVPRMVRLPSSLRMPMAMKTAQERTRPAVRTFS